IEGRDARRGHASAIHYGRLRFRIPDQAAGRGADLRPRRWRFGNERDSSRVSGVGPVGDRVVQPGQSFGFAHGRLAPRPYAAQVVPTTGEAERSSRKNQKKHTKGAVFCTEVNEAKKGAGDFTANLR